MKNNSLRLLTFLFAALLAFAGTPAFANALSTPAAMQAALTASGADGQNLTFKKKSEKRGFFGKVKAFGAKTKLFFKAAKSVFAAGDHNAVVAILLTLFLGGLGIHRVYLGGRPLLILLYIITFGGIFGILPLIDLIRLIIGHMDHYEDNNSFIAAFQ